MLNKWLVRRRVARSLAVYVRWCNQITDAHERALIFFAR